MKRAALYVRVSTAEQKKYGISVDSQIDALRKYCKENDLKEVDLYNDAGISGHISYKKRPALLRLIKDCRDGKVDLIIFTKLDRWFRSTKDYYLVQEQIGDVPWSAIWEDYNTETSEGIFKVQIMLAVAESEALRTSERLKAVNEFRRERGDYLGGKPPLGFQRDGNKLTIKEPEWSAVYTLLKSYSEYLPLDDCIRAAQAGGFNFSKNTAYRLLHSPLVAEHLPDEMRTAVAARLSENRTRKPLKIEYNYLFQGLVKCGYCKRAMTSLGRKRHSQVRGDYIQRFYQCHNYANNFGNSIPCTEGTAINEEILEQLLIDNIEAAIDAYNLTVSASLNKKASTDAQKKIDALNGKLKRLTELYEDGDVSRDDYKIKRDAIKKELAEASKIIQMPQKVPALPSNWKDLYNMLDRDGKRIYWHKIIKQVKVYRNHQIEIIF